MFPDYLGLLPPLLVGALKHYVIANTQWLQRTSTFVAIIFNGGTLMAFVQIFVVARFGKVGKRKRVTLKNIIISTGLLQTA